MTPRAIIFDIGNVLMFHDNALLERNLAAFFACSVPDLRRVLSRDFRVRAGLGQLSAAEIHAEICRGLASSFDYERFASVYCSHFSMNDSIEPLVQSLKGRYRLLTLSNTDAIHVEWMRRHLPVLDCFDACILSCETGLAKPDARFYQEAVRRAGVRPEECIFTDDVPEFVEAARQVGLQAAVFRERETFREDLLRLGVEF